MQQLVYDTMHAWGCMGADAYACAWSRSHSMVYTFKHNIIGPIYTYQGHSMRIIIHAYMYMHVSRVMGMYIEKYTL